MTQTRERVREQTYKKREEQRALVCGFQLWRCKLFCVLNEGAEEISKGKGRERGRKETRGKSEKERNKLDYDKEEREKEGEQGKEKVMKQVE